MQGHHAATKKKLIRSKYKECEKKDNGKSCKARQAVRSMGLFQLGGAVSPQQGPEQSHGSFWKFHLFPSESWMVFTDRRARSHWIKIVRFCIRRCSFPWQFEHQAMQNRQESHNLHAQSPGRWQFASLDFESSDFQSRARFLLAGGESAARGFNPHHGSSNMTPRWREMPKDVVTRGHASILGFSRHLIWLLVQKRLMHNRRWVGQKWQCDRNANDRRRLLMHNHTILIQCDRALSWKVPRL